MNSFNKKKTNPLRKENMVSLSSLSKSKFFTHVTIVSFVSQSCCTCVVVTHSSCTGVSRITILSPLSYLCCTCVALMSH